MPNYLFLCDKCESYTEIILPMADRDSEQRCVTCDAVLERQLTTANFSGVYQAGAIMTDGSFVPGHFGKSAPRLRKKS